MDDFCSDGNDGDYNPWRPTMNGNRNRPIVEACVATIITGTPGHNWQGLSQFTELVLDSGETWHRSEKLHQWFDSIQLEAVLVSTPFQTYTNWVKTVGYQLYEQFQKKADIVLNVPTPPFAATALEPRLAVYLQRALPEKVRVEALAIVEGNGTLIRFSTTPFRSLAFTLAVIEYACPWEWKKEKASKSA